MYIDDKEVLLYFLKPAWPSIYGLKCYAV
jgi:hypothetical protein